MNVDLQEFERQFNIWQKSWDDRKDLDYLNLDSSSKSDISHNLLVTSYRVDLGNKALFALTKQNCLHILELRGKLQEQTQRFEEVQQISKIVRQQRADIKQIIKDQEQVKGELR